MGRGIRCLLTLAAVTAVAGFVESAQADELDDFIAVFKSLADTAEANTGDCATQTAALTAFVDANLAKVVAVAPAIRDAKFPEAQDKALEGHADRFQTATNACPDASIAMLGLLAPLLEKGPVNFDALSEAELQSEALVAVAEGAVSYYQEEHLSADGSSVTTRVFPAAAKPVCDAGAETWNDTYAAAVVGAAAKRGIEVCYAVAPDQKRFAASAVLNGKGGRCVSGTVDANAAPRVTSLVDQDKAGCMAMAAADQAAPEAKGPEVKEAAAKAPVNKAPAAPSTEPATPKVTATEVEAMCTEWSASATMFGKDCDALGKRLQRQFKALTYTLDDVPRYGDYRRALKICKDAAAATRKCDGNAELEAATRVFGKL